MNKDIAQFALETALNSGADRCRVCCAESLQTSVSYLNGEIEKLQESKSGSIGLSIFVDGRFGVFSTNRTERDELTAFLKRCVESCRLLSPDECRALPDPALYYKGGMPDLMLMDPSFEAIPFERKTEVLRKVDSEAGREDQRIISVATDYDDCLRTEYIVDSQGLEVNDTRTAFTVSCECTVKGAGDERPQNGWYEGASFMDALALDCGKKAYDRTIAMLGARKIKSGKYNVVLDNSVSSRAVSSIVAALKGASIQQKNSFLLDSLGKRVFPESLCIADNPHRIGAPGSYYYDSEGVASSYRDIVKDGTVCTYLLDTYHANKLGMDRTTGDTFSVFFPKDSGMGLEGIMAAAGSGILVTGFNGGNSNPVTGDFSYGIEGFYFENGRVLYPVKEMNMTGNFISMWDSNLFVGNDPIPFLQWQIPTLAFGNMDISGL